MTLKKMFLFSLLAFILFAFRDANNRRSVHRRFFNRHLDGDIYIEVVKSNYELKVFDQDGWYATYPVVFGSKSLDDKMMAGDRKTPEGEYHIVSKRPHEKWDKMMLIDFPTKLDYEKFNARKAQGLIPRSAQIGGGIAIHGTWPHDDIAVDLYQNWTNGCIALKNEDCDELYDMIRIGTKVTIQR
ncbi:MAG TPA: L,D-transpeptidase [Puia sp.]|nr:L,D-transpeptidase [Puia sp.]